MRARLLNVWENISAGMWFVPSVMVVLAFVLSSVLIEVDRGLARGGSTLIPWLFGGSAGAAHALLAVIAGSLITAISIALSITIVALQLASSQFTPRVLRTSFTSDRGTQIVFGAYAGTFMYALLVMRQVRELPNGDTSFVPALSITVALGLALLCLGLLIYFIHHISQLVQVAVVMDHVHDELVEEIDRFYPHDPVDNVKDQVPALDLVARLERAGKPGYLRSSHAGYIRSIDEQTLFDASDGRISWLWIRPQVGDYVPHGAVLVEFAADGAIDRKQLDQIRDAFVLENERSIYQDPLFGIRQLVDIALKALSPAINDPTTAEYCLSHLGDALGRLAVRDFPPAEITGPRGQTRYIFSRPAWDEFVSLAFAQIRSQAFDNVHVTGYLLSVLYELAVCLPPGARGRAVQHEVDEIRRILDAGHFSPADTAMLRRQADDVDEVLQPKLAQSSTVAV